MSSATLLVHLPRPSSSAFAGVMTPASHPTTTNAPSSIFPITATAHVQMLSASALAEPSV
eukprot:5528719-Alexandrium_andersonii.AAC.1